MIYLVVFQLAENSLIANILAANIEFASDSIECSKIACSNEIAALETQIDVVEAENKEMRVKYYDMLVDNLKKDLEIESLEEKCRSNKRYSNFEEHLSTESMDTLRSYDITKKNDSKFVLAAVRGLYANRLEVLKNKTVSGRSKSQPKEKITPTKMTILRELFKTRIGDDMESSGREKSLSKMVKSAIEQINKTQN